MKTINAQNPQFNFINKLNQKGKSTMFNTKESLSILSFITFIFMCINGFAQDTMWTKRYNGPGSMMDVGMSVAADIMGNVYVTGISAGTSATGHDFCTIKYGPDGTPSPTWPSMGFGPGVRRYTSPTSGGWDQAVKVCVDATLNVYVTGYVDNGTPTHIDFCTIKYSPSGAMMWVMTYDGGLAGGGYDYATAMAVDGAGNCYVTGMSPGDPMHIDYKDYVTIKYSPGGAPLWIARYDGPGHQDDDPSAIRVDASGNVYVTGDSFFGPSEAKNFMTIKYSPSGTALWYAPYNNPALSNNDYGYDLVVDGSGNVFVTGVTIGMGSVVIKDYATVKYSSTGVQVWANVYSGPAYDDIPSGITLDPSGNVIVTGRSDEPGSSHDFDYCTIKYSTAGAQVWVARFVGPGVDDEPTAIIADMSGNVFVTGKSHGPSHYDYQTIEYNSSGVQVWSSRYNGPDPSSNDQASSIALCPDGRPVVTGFSSTSVFGPSSYDYLTIKYSPMVTGVTGNQNEAPDNFGLSQNYPNPFNPSTTIRYQIPNSGLVKLAVYDMLGKQVTILVNDIKDAGSYEIRFDGSKLSSGVYFYKLETDNFSDVKRMNLVK